MPKVVVSSAFSVDVQLMSDHPQTVDDASLPITLHLPIHWLLVHSNDCYVLISSAQFAQEDANLKVLAL